MSFASDNSGSKCGISFSPSPHKLTGVTTDCISRVRFSPVNCPMTLLGVTAWDGTCSIWQVTTSANRMIESKPFLTTTHDGPLLDMSFTADGRAFFAGCTKTAVMWDLRSNQKAVVAAHDLPISCIAHVTAPQTMTEMFITGSWDGKLRWWDLRQPTPVKEEKLNEPIFAIDAQKTFPMLAVATGRLVHVYDLQTLQKYKELTPPDVMKFNFRCVTCSPQFDGVGVGSSEGRVSYIPWNESQGCTFKCHMQASASSYSLYQTNFCVHHPSKPIIVSGGGDGSICALNRLTRKMSRAIECQEKFEEAPIPISSGDFSGDGILLAYAHSYDWAMGAAFYRNQPTSVNIRSVTLMESESTYYDTFNVPYLCLAFNKQQQQQQL